jgi:hypothetical protein
MKDTKDLVTRLRDYALTWPETPLGALTDEAALALEAAEAALKNYRERDDWTYRGRALAAEARAEELMSTLDCHAGFCSHHVECNGPVAKHRGDPK